MNGMIFRMMLAHQKLDEELRREQARRWPDPLRIQKLKKLKLALKDRLFRLTLGRVAPRMA